MCQIHLFGTSFDVACSRNLVRLQEQTMGNTGGPLDRSISLDLVEDEDERQRRTNFVDNGDLRIWES
jgi:hypothetical protein